MSRRETDEMDVAAVQTRIHKVIRASAVRHGWEAVDDNTPLDELVAREAVDGQSSEERKVREEVVTGIFGWLFAKGPDPGVVMKRLYSAVHLARPELVIYMTQADLGLLLGDNKQCQSYRLKVLFKGQVRARSQKRAGASAAYSKAQQGNNSRRKGERRKRREAEQN